MAVSTDVATLAAACRRCLANGTSFTGAEIRLCIDTLETLANTTDSKAVATVTAWAAAQVTALAAWTACGAGDSSAVYTTQSALLITARAAAVTAAAASVTDVTANDQTDGRFV